MKLLVLTSAVLTVCNGLSIQRDALQSQSRLSPRSDIPDLEIGGVSLFSLLGPGTLFGNLIAWWTRDNYEMPKKYESMPPRLRATSTRDRLWYGPIKLPAINDPDPVHRGLDKPAPLKMDPTSIQVNKRIAGFCNDCTVLSGKASLFFENGTKAGVDSGVYIHHIVTVDMSQSSKAGLPFYLCQEQSGFLGTWGAPAFLISGNDEAPNMFTTPDGSFNSGYHFTDSRWVAMQSELVNYRKEEQQVYVVIDYEWIKGDSAGAKEPVPARSAVSLLSVTGCKPPDFHPTERKYNVVSKPVPIPHNGFIINAKGHLHDGGDYAVLKLNGKEICRSNAVYGKSATDINISGGAHGHWAAGQQSPLDDPVGISNNGSGNGNATDWAVITEMTQCTEPVAVRKGDYLSMVAYIDGIKHPPRPLTAGSGGDMDGGHKMMEADEMGVFFVNFATSNETAAQLTLSTEKTKLPRTS